MDKRLQDLKGTFKRQDVLLPDIERHVLKKSRIPSDRRTDVLHPSEMAKSDWCGRSSYYRIIGEEGVAEKAPSFRLSNIFDYGHSVHAKYQRWLAEMGVLWGMWQCAECRVKWLDTSPIECECGSKRVVYAEVPLELPSLNIAGHCDGIVIGEVNRMIEIKTVGISTLRFENFKLFDRYQREQLTPDELFFNIKSPFATHIRQGQLYLHIAKTAYPSLDIDEIVFIYEWKPTQDVKEFRVKYNSDFIAGVLDVAEEVSSSLSSGTVPSRPPWAESPEARSCSSCEYRSTCWGVNDRVPANQKTNSIKVKRAPARRRARL